MSQVHRIPVRFPLLIHRDLCRTRATKQLSVVATPVAVAHTRGVSASMAADSNDSGTLKKFLDFPGEHVLAHEGAEWMKSAFASLAAARLAVTAETGDLLALEEIIDIPLNSMPMLALGHRDYERRMVARLKISQDNTRNHLKRRRLLWEAHCCRGGVSTVWALYIDVSRLIF